MIIPTSKYLDEEVQDESGYFQILSDMHLSGASVYLVAEIVYLPSPSVELETSETKQGPIQGAILEWLQAHPELSWWKSATMRSDLLDHSPRRWSTYRPMLLLPSRSFQDATWKTVLQSVDQSHLSTLWKGILRAVWLNEGGTELSHLAINSGIPLKQDSLAASGGGGRGENILRSPSGLIMLCGDFGPALDPVARESPTEQDFQDAFWVSAKQNGIYQTWAPRHTMFSRGNIKEKARLLSFHDEETALTAARKQAGPMELADATAVDLYAGIGYFAFSYVQMGLQRVLCWEINPWSVEGLRRGCQLNGWSCRIVRGGDLARPVGDLLRDGAKVIVFEESNERASERTEQIWEWQEAITQKVLGDVLHVNCGFLPSSEPSWPIAWKILRQSTSAWLHLHENVGLENAKDVETRRKEIEEVIESWNRGNGTSRIVKVEHVEPVKSFAPGVWHCVFDIYISSTPKMAPNI